MYISQKHPVKPYKLHGFYPSQCKKKLLSQKELLIKNLVLKNKNIHRIILKTKPRKQKIQQQSLSKKQ